MDLIMVDPDPLMTKLYKFAILEHTPTQHVSSLVQLYTLAPGDGPKWMMSWVFKNGNHPLKTLSKLTYRISG